MGECPVWEERENALVYVDINSQKVCRWSPVTNEVQSVSVGKSPRSLPHPGTLSVPSAPPGRSPAGWWSLMGLHSLSAHNVLLSTVWPKLAKCSAHVAPEKPKWEYKFHLGPAEEKVQS